MNATAEQTEFDFLVLFSKPLLRVDEVCSVLRCGKDTVYALADAGKLEVHQNDAERSHLKITRRSLVAHVSRTARYVPADFVETLFSLARRLPADQRALLIKRLQNL